MTRIYAIAAAFAAVSIGVACAAQATATNPSQAEIKSLERTAHTAQQYQTLANYFKARQANFEQQAQAEKQEWERRSQITASIYEKYPRPVDSSRNRYEYFSYEAGQMGQQAAHFDALSASAAQ